MKKVIKQIFDCDRKEFPIVVLMFSFSFLVTAVFQILKPLKKGLFVGTYGAHTELYAKLANIAVAAVAVVVFTYLYNKLERDRLIYFLSLFFVVSFLILAYVLVRPGRVAIWSFYLLGDLVTTFLVAAFWAYLTDISNQEQAKSLFGLIGSGLVAGGWAGASLAMVLKGSIGMRGFLNVAAVAMLALCLVIFLAERWIRRTGVFRNALNTRLVIPDPKLSKTNAAFQGAKLVINSKYLLAIVAILVFYEFASQLVEYQWTSMAQKISGVAATQAYMIEVYFYTNLLSVTVQLFLVGLIMKRFGMVTALLVLPLAVLASSIAFLAMPALLISSVLYVSDSGLNYSIQQTARETLYVPTSSDDKYKARAFTNMFVQRLAKGGAILMTLGLGIAGIDDVRYLSLIVIPVLVLMGLCGIYAGRRFAEKSALGEPELKVAPVNLLPSPVPANR